MTKYNYLKPEVVEMLQAGTLLEQGPGEPTRYACAAAMLELGAKNEKVVVLDADVSKSIKTWDFGQEFPGREYNFGISEQNMVAAAAGMSTYGLVPFVATYAVFMSMRALDQVRNSICYPNNNVKLIASHSGITPAPDGVTHQGQEDMSLMRAMPNMTIVAPGDPVTAKKATFAIAEHVGPTYLSLTRCPVPELYTDDYPFEIGKAVTIREGGDVTIIAYRDMVVQALVAAETLAKTGLDVRVIDCHTVKPLDTETIENAARETGAVVTAEDNVLNGGMGEAVAAFLIEHQPVPMRRIGLQDRFAESGAYETLIEKYGISANHICKAVQDVIRFKAMA